MREIEAREGERQHERKREREIEGEVEGIESLLFGHPGIPDEKFGEEVCVWIRPKGKDVTLEEVSSKHSHMTDDNSSHLL